MGIEPSTSCMGGRNTYHYTTSFSNKIWPLVSWLQCTELFLLEFAKVDIWKGYSRPISCNVSLLQKMTNSGYLQLLLIVWHHWQPKKEQMLAKVSLRFGILAIGPICANGDRKWCQMVTMDLMATMEHPIPIGANGSPVAPFSVTIGSNGANGKNSKS